MLSEHQTKNELCTIVESVRHLAVCAASELLAQYDSNENRKFILEHIGETDMGEAVGTIVLVDSELTVGRAMNVFRHVKSGTVKDEALFAAVQHEEIGAEDLGELVGDLDPNHSYYRTAVEAWVRHPGTGSMQLERLLEMLQKPEDAGLRKDIVLHPNAGYDVLIKAATMDASDLRTLALDQLQAESRVYIGKDFEAMISHLHEEGHLAATVKVFLREDTTSCEVLSRVDCRLEYSDIDAEAFWAQFLTHKMSIGQLLWIFGCFTDPKHGMRAAKKIVRHKSMSAEYLKRIHSRINCAQAQNLWLDVLGWKNFAKKSKRVVASYLVSCGSVSEVVLELAAHILLDSKDSDLTTYIHVYENVESRRDAMHEKIVKCLPDLSLYQLTSLMRELESIAPLAWDEFKAREDLDTWELHNVIEHVPMFREQAWEKLKACPKFDRSDLHRVVEVAPEFRNEVEVLEATIDNREIIETMCNVAKEE